MTEREASRRLEAVTSRAARRQKPDPRTGSRRSWAKVLSVDEGPPATVTVEFEPGGTAVGPLRYLATGFAPEVDDYVMVINVDGDVVVFGRMAYDLDEHVGLADTRGFLFPFTLGSGVVVVDIYPQRFRTDIAALEVLGVTLAAGFGEGPVGDDIVADLVLGDTGDTMWPDNPTLRPTILDGNEETLAEHVPDDPIVPVATSIRVEVVQRGNPTPGSNCVLMMRARWVP